MNVLKIVIPNVKATKATVFIVHGEMHWTVGCKIADCRRGNDFPKLTLDQTFSDNDIHSINANLSWCPCFCFAKNKSDVLAVSNVPEKPNPFLKTSRQKSVKLR
ncbi:hypothetical protein T4E_430 [Trichinella pseudospiralis]|uniref:Uncharacterized protein n=2 Tax=Trichinella pseudospiralis TaxID=6337 RepID=A0A0V1G471_TRIPS|nr:hypothetical protein T4E_430 [Trichinella pseudospiralis]KRY92917.1 hypothetical protein T4D_12177 [Trichinella pseudospiralis]